MFALVRLLSVFVALLVGSIALIVQGDVEAGGIVLLVLTMIAMAVIPPFRSMPRPRRVRFRLGATAAVLAAWFTAGTVRWDWHGSNYAIAGAVAAYALVRAARPRSQADAPAGR